MSPVPPATAPTPARSPARDIAFIGGSLLAVLTIAWFSLVTQPAALTTSAWWPAAGVALGLGLRYPRRFVWPLAAAVGVITFVIAVWAGRGAPLSALLSLSTAIEMIIGTVILRGRRDVLPALAAPRDIVRLLLAITVAAVVYALLSSGAALAVGDPAGAWTRLVTAAPKHGAGMILLAPLFMHLPRRPRQAGTVETLLQVTAALAVAVLVFVINGRLPLAFLPFVPLVWAATRLSTRLLLVQMLAIAVIASYGSAYGGGPFAFARLGPETGSIVLQIFELSMVIVFLALSLSVGHERDTAQRLHDSQDLFRKIFDNSVAGKLIIRRQDDGWYVLRSNPSAAAILPELNEGKSRLRDLLGERAARAVCTKANDLTDTNALVTVTTDRGRILYISITLISRPGQDRVLALQFHDITEAARARRLEQEELERAAEMARALLPWEIPHAPGWSAAALSVPAKQVGGDFYDLRISDSHAVLSLGDVMGKGVAAGMLAAAARAALRANTPEMSPAEAVAKAAGVLEGDLHRSSAFVTLAYLQVDLASGEYGYTDAGHGLHFIVRGCGARVERVASEDMPMGLGHGWQEMRGTLEPGDAVLLVSDGVMDLWGGSVEQLHDAVSACVRQHCGDPQAVLDALCGNAGGAVERDDVTAVVLGRDPLASKVNGNSHEAGGHESVGMT